MGSTTPRIRATCVRVRARRRWLAGGLAAVLVLVVAMTAAGCSSGRKQHAAGGTPVDVDSSASGKPLRVKVDPAAPFALTIPGVVTISGDPGSVSSAGQITAQALQGDASGQAGLSIAGKGVDVTFQGTRLTRKITVTFTDVAPPEDPQITSAVLHRADDGTTDLVAARRVSNGLQFRTKDFSPNFPININLGAWFKARLDSISDYVTGRTDPGSCQNNAPSWARFTTNSDLIHECAVNNPDKNGVDRAEAQFTTNRRFWLTARVPNGAAYVWVKDQPNWLRSVLAAVEGENPSNFVFLDGTDGAMTAGYYRPTGQSQNLTFTFMPDAVTQMLTLTETILSGFDVGGRGLTSATILLLATCKEDIPGLLGSVESQAPKFMQCIAEQAGDQLSDDSKAFASAMGLFGDAGYATDAASALGKVKSSMQILGWVLKATGFISALRNEVDTVIDNFLGLIRPGSQHATFTLTAKQAPAPATTIPATPPHVTSMPSSIPAPSSTTSISAIPGNGAGGSANPAFTGGYVIDDSIYGGTWPRTDPNDGTWYDSAHRPANAASYWWRDGLGVGFSCGIINGAPYSVKYVDGRPAQTWTTWLRSTDTWGGRVTGLWVPSAVADNIFVDGLPPGMPTC